MNYDLKDLIVSNDNFCSYNDIYFKYNRELSIKLKILLMDIF